MKTLTILVVEDEHLILELTRTLLEDSGYDVVCAPDAETAQDVLNDRHADLGALVSDIRLHGSVSGWEIARAARRLAPKLPVVYITGDSAADWSAEGVPGSLLLQKPFAPAQLITAVSQLLNLSDSEAGTSAS